MSDQHDEKNIEGHVYDGISELDNPLPGWWLWTFLLTIIFAFIYYLHYEIAGGPTLKQELAVAMEGFSERQKQTAGPIETETELQAQMQGSEVLTLGSKVYAEKCAACHAAELQGQIGPNLVDKYWIQGKGTRQGIVKVIREGVLDKGMPNWDQMLSKDEILAAAAFILSKQGSNPANAKAPQGELVGP